MFKSFFARPKDGLDIATMVAVGSIDLDYLEQTVVGLLGDVDDRARFFSRIREDLQDGL